MSRIKRNDYLEYKNPIHVIWRKGTPEDPFVNRIDIMPVVNQRIILSEIPDQLTRLKIGNMKEINHERFIDETIEPNEFYCDYSNGFVYFHASREAETLPIDYKARGIILTPSTRIIHTTGENVKELLSELIDRSTTQINDLIERTKMYEEYLEKLDTAIDDAKDATNHAKDVTQEAQNVITKLEKTWETTILTFKPPIPNINEINNYYPNPEVGWTTQTTDNGNRWRWDGSEWVLIDSMVMDLPLANEQIHGLMSKENFVKLKGFSTQANKKTVVFVLPQENIMGIQDPHVFFPYKGKIYNIEVSASIVGKEDTEIEILKSTDFQNWHNITAQNIILPANEHFANDEILALTEVNAGDIFKINLPEVGGTSNLSINIDIELDPTI